MRRRFGFAFISIIILSLVVTGVIEVYLLKKDYLTKMQEELERESRIITMDLNIDPLNIKNISDQYSRIYGDRISIIDPTGKVIIDTDKQPDELENHIDRPEIEAVLEGKIGTSIRYSITVGKEMMYVASKVTLKNQVYILRLSRELDLIDKFVAKVTTAVLFASAISMLLALIMIDRIRDFILGPLRRLLDELSGMSSGDIDKKLFENYDEELGMIIDKYSKLNQEINDKIIMLNSANQTLNSVLENVKSGILALDEDHRIIFINSYAKEVFNIGIEDPRGRRLTDHVRNLNLVEFIDSLDFDNSEKFLDFDRNDRHYLITASFVDNWEKSGRIILIQDLTDIRKLENMRKDFVANVSHELKTPLTSIKGFIETLKAGAMENEKLRGRFLDIIDLESDRLFLLINDLLFLSEVENKRIASTNETEVTSILDEICDMLDSKSKDRNINLIRTYKESSPCYVVTNSHWFKQIFINLIDNSIKYNKLDGSVDVGIYDEPDKVAIYVKDTGIGIDKSDIDRIFERFYRVDKARSKEIGGTGLGLSIVKHLIISLGAEIEIDSEMEKGTQIIVRFKKDSEE